MLLALVSGGASALATLPIEGVSLDSKAALTRQLLASGAPIADINLIRRHLSQFKGGKLAATAYPARVVTLIVSDVPGDDPAAVGSGPTIADGTLPQDALETIVRYGVDAPLSVLDALRRPAQPVRRHGDPPVVIARARNALDAVAGHLAASGYRVVDLGDDLEGDAATLGKHHADLAIANAACGGRLALISGGETTVTVTHAGGRGGRNSTYALALMNALGGRPGISGMAADTDGIDGSEDNAGAWFDSESLSRGRQIGLDPAALLVANRSYDFFAGLGQLIVTGPTRTNVNDLRVILIEA